MAEATVKTSVTLTLTGKEAETLVGILGRVGGSPDNSDRKYVDSIYKALSGCAIEYNGSELDDSIYLPTYK
jgi:hypothetical protein